MITDLTLIDAPDYSYQTKTVPLLSAGVHASDDLTGLLKALGVYSESTGGARWVTVPKLSMSDDIETDIAVPDSAVTDQLTGESMLHTASIATRYDRTRKHWTMYFIVGEDTRTKGNASHTIHLSMIVSSSVLSEGMRLGGDWSILPKPSGITMSLPAITDRIVRKADIVPMYTDGDHQYQLMEVAVVTSVEPHPDTNTPKTGLYATIGWCMIAKTVPDDIWSLSVRYASVVTNENEVKTSICPLIDQKWISVMAGAAKSDQIVGVFASPASLFSPKWDASKSAWSLEYGGKSIIINNYYFRTLELPYHNYGFLSNLSFALTDKELAYGGRLTVIDQAGQCVADLPPTAIGFAVQTVLDATGYYSKIVPFAKDPERFDDSHAVTLPSTPLSWAGDAWLDYAKSQMAYDREIMHQSVKALTDGRSLSTAGDIAGQAISMAAAGATIGMMGGPIGAGAGALIGAAAGLGTSATGMVSRWIQTDNQVRQLKAAQSAKEDMYRKAGSSSFVPTSSEQVMIWLQHKYTMSVCVIMPTERSTGEFDTIAKYRGYPADEVSIQTIDSGCYQGQIVRRDLDGLSSWHHVQLENEFAAGIRFI